MRARLVLGFMAVPAILSCSVSPLHDPPGLEWVDRVSAAGLVPPPPPDCYFPPFSLPLNASDAGRLLAEAPVFAPWGVGYGGRPLQALAINVLLTQPNATARLEGFYRTADPPGRLLALCALQSADPGRFSELSKSLTKSTQQVIAYSGGDGRYATVSGVLAEMLTTPVCIDIPKSEERIVSECERGYVEVEDISMVQLLATPERFHNKRVRVIGFLGLEFEGNALYLHEDDLKNRISRNAIWFDIPRSWEKHPPALSDHYVLVEGTFDSKSLGHMGAFSGTITSVTRAEIWR